MTITILNRNAHQKFATPKPGIIAETKSINKAFMTKVKRPRVKILIGKVKNISIGFINVFTKPKAKAVINAHQKPLTDTPGKI